MKTIEEAAKEELNYTLNVQNSFKRGVEFAQRWIPIEEDLPVLTVEKPQVQVLIKSKAGRIYLSYYDIWKGWHSNANIAFWRQIQIN